MVDRIRQNIVLTKKRGNENMLELKGITKTYVTGGEKVEALKGIDLKFRESEFVSILRSKWMWKNNFIKYHWWLR